MPNMTRKLPAILSAVVLMLVLAGCEQGTDGPEAGATVEDIQEQFAAFEEDLGALEDRIGALEAGAEEVDAADDVIDDAPAADEAFFDDVQSYVGQQVTVSAEVESIIDTHAFTLDGPREPLLVVSATGSGDSELVEDGSVVKVTGTVQESFNVADVEEEFGIDLDDELFEDFGDEHYIVADQVSEPATVD